MEEKVMKDCKVLALCSQKGGVGKTTSCVNLAVGLAKAGKKVLVIDNDPQGSMTASLGYTDCYMSAFGGMEQSESLISTKGGMCHEYKSNIPLFSRNGMRYVQFLSYSQTAVYK